MIGLFGSTLLPQIRIELDLAPHGSRGLASSVLILVSLQVETLAHTKPDRWTSSSSNQGSSPGQKGIRLFSRYGWRWLLQVGKPERPGHSKQSIAQKIATGHSNGSTVEQSRTLQQQDM